MTNRFEQDQQEVPRGQSERYIGDRDNQGYTSEYSTNMPDTASILNDREDVLDPQGSSTTQSWQREKTPNI